VRGMELKRSLFVGRTKLCGRSRNLSEKIIQTLGSRGKSKEQQVRMENGGMSRRGRRWATCSAGRPEDIKPSLSIKRSGRGRINFKMEKIKASKGLISNGHRPLHFDMTKVEKDRNKGGKSFLNKEKKGGS